MAAAVRLEARRTSKAVGPHPVYTGMRSQEPEITYTLVRRFLHGVVHD